MRLYRDRWQARGFRSPAMIRHAAGIERLGFDYDTSYRDTDPYQPQAGGCCTWLPFFNSRVVELPITLAQDHTLFEILGERDERRWVRSVASTPARCADHASRDTIPATRLAIVHCASRDDCLPLPLPTSGRGRREAVAIHRDVWARLPDSCSVPVSLNSAALARAAGSTSTTSRRPTRAPSWTSILGRGRHACVLIAVQPSPSCGLSTPCRPLVPRRCRLTVVELAVPPLRTRRIRIEPRWPAAVVSRGRRGAAGCPGAPRIR